MPPGAMASLMVALVLLLCNWATVLHVGGQRTGRSLQSVVSDRDIAECFRLGAQRARVVFNAPFPVVTKASSSAPPSDIRPVILEVKPRSRDFSYNAAIVEGMVRCLTARYQLTTQEVHNLVEMELKSARLDERCSIPTERELEMKRELLSARAFTMKEFMRKNTNPCLNHPFRTISGYCNNPIHPFWGNSFRPFTRFLPPDYDDGIGAPRMRSRVTLRLLPSARRVSFRLHTDRRQPHHMLTHMVMQWGQFLDHDITHSPTAVGRDDKTPKCCDERRRHPDCFPITVPRDDPYFPDHNRTCIEFVRSLATTRPGCRLGPREQINQLTSFIDGSVIYGSSEAEEMYLRSFSEGKMRVAPIQRQHGVTKKGLLPADLFTGDCTKESDDAHLSCFKAGDIRVNEQVGLTAMHTVWLREHNRLATELALINPHWQDERLFQEARKIVGAQMQAVTYGQWLPQVLGEDMMDAYQLSLRPDGGFFYGYNVSSDASIANVFSSAAFRFGHSLIASALELYNAKGRLMRRDPLVDVFFQPFELYQRARLDEYVKGMCVQAAEQRDRHMSRQITERLFEDPPGAHGRGGDLAARNIQRGRDHGLPPYVDWRRSCGLEVPLDFTGLRALEVMPEDALVLLEELYE